MADQPTKSGSTTSETSDGNAQPTTPLPPAAVKRRPSKAAKAAGGAAAVAAAAATAAVFGDDIADSATPDVHGAMGAATPVDLTEQPGSSAANSEATRPVNTTTTTTPDDESMDAFDSAPSTGGPGGASMPTPTAPRSASALITTEAASTPAGAATNTDTVQDRKIDALVEEAQRDKTTGAADEESAIAAGAIDDEPVEETGGVETSAERSFERAHTQVGKLVDDFDALVELSPERASFIPARDADLVGIGSSIDGISGDQPSISPTGMAPEPGQRIDSGGMSVSPTGMAPEPGQRLAGRPPTITPGAADIIGGLDVSGPLTMPTGPPTSPTNTSTGPFTLEDETADSPDAVDVGGPLIITPGAASMIGGPDVRGPLTGAPEDVALPVTQTATEWAGVTVRPSDEGSADTGIVMPVNDGPPVFAHVDVDPNVFVGASIDDLPFDASHLDAGSDDGIDLDNVDGI